jgi:hypothetical protein
MMRRSRVKVQNILGMGSGYFAMMGHNNADSSAKQYIVSKLSAWRAGGTLLPIVTTQRLNRAPMQKTSSRNNMLREL